MSKRKMDKIMETWKKVDEMWNRELRKIYGKHAQRMRMDDGTKHPRVTQLRNRYLALRNEWLREADECGWLCGYREKNRGKDEEQV